MIVSTVGFDGANDLDLIGALIAFRKAASLDAKLEVSVGATSPFRTASGLLFEDVTPVSDLVAADALLIPGGSASFGVEDASLLDAIGRAVGQLHFVCSGVALGLKAGLDLGDMVAVHHRKAALMGELGFMGRCVSGRVRNGRYSSYSGVPRFGGTKGIWAALEVLRHLSERLAARTAGELEVEYPAHLEDELRAG